MKFQLRSSYSVVSIGHGVAILAGITGLYAVSRFNYLLFHGIAEMFSIVIAFAIFFFAWNSRHYARTDFFKFLGIVFLFVGAVDFLHCLAYQGMNVLNTTGANPATQLWILGRYLQSISFIAAVFFIRRKLPDMLFIGLIGGIVILAIFSIFTWQNFPAAYIDGEGLTAFKIISEFVISGLFVIGIIMLRKNRQHFDERVVKLLTAALVITIASEMAFTLYTDVYGAFNVLGHFLKIIAFYLIYVAIIETGLSKPYSVLIKEISDSEMNFRNSLDESPLGIRIVTEDGDLLYSNQALLDMYGYGSIEEMKSVPTNRRYTPESYDEYQVRRRKRREGEYVPSNYQITIVRKDGTNRHLNVFRREVIWNRSVQYQVIYEDITQRMEVEKRIREERDRAHRYLDMAGTMILVLAPDGTVSLINRKGSEILGYGEKEILGKNWFDTFIPPDIREDLRSVFLSQTESTPENQTTYENPVLTRNGEKRLIAWNNSILQDEGGRIAGVISSGEDITERKQLEESLRFSDTALKSIHESVVAMDADFTVTYWNEISEEMYGVKADAAMGKYIGDVVTMLEEYPGQNKERIDLLLSQGYAREEQRYLTPHGEVWIDETVQSIEDEHGNRYGWVTLAADITERKRIETELRENEKRLREAQELGRIGSWDYDIENGKIEWSDVTYELYGRDKTLGPPTEQEEAGYYAPGEAERLRVLSGRAIRECRQFETDITANLPNGRKAFFHTTMRPVTTEDGRVVRLFGTVQDITARKTVEEQLQFQASLVDNVTDTIMTRDDNFIILSWNKAGERMYGWKDEEVIGKDIRTLFSIDFKDISIDEINRQLARQGYWTGEVTHHRKDGTPMEVRATSLTIKGKENVHLSIFTDITEEKRAAEERLRAAKLESVGTLAGGIAHDFNNLLTGIMGNIGLADMSVQDGDLETTAQRLHDALNASTRARDLTSQLLTYARGGAPVKKALSLKELIPNSVNFALHGSNVRAEFNIADDLWTIEGDEGQINQVLSNLTINAYQAMPKGGLLLITAYNTDISDTDSDILPDGPYVLLSVTDHGNGIPRANISKIFEPYFTTKSRGSGLGLATVYSIVKNHGGTIEVDSRPGEGTTFRVYLPSVGMALEPDRSKPGDPLPGGTGKILVMDDESTIRSFLDRALTRAGYRVFVSADGQEALDLYRKALGTDEPFDAVIMDLTVPGGMGGKETIRELKTLHPEVKAIVSSGYANDPIMSEYRDYGFSAVVSKPYRLHDLMTAIKTVIGSKT